ncbi:LysR family transcriptional regulator [Diaphorobacter ruginosibacter]|uniref:LysR family transcriptional regulator n=1 Tax=Diaphorobacter ruginosibacter TaxID=1715720 RepID=A0A7G9RNX8_9BURK|nr:LysR family transcriptional regulator [Diaphorobacter ruginosibacter]QNN57303.1 LysR family transcriptional regulator [Diaphorobacter ruginosibacter]
MELRHLKGFLAVAQEQSFTRAAKKLHMAQPPLSQRIRELEDELGVKLFERCTRRVHLTQAGETFLEGVQSLLLQLEQAVEACRKVERGERGMLRVGYTGRASQQLLPRLVLSFRQRYPDVQLDIQGPHPTGWLRSALQDGRLDVALCFLPLHDAQIETRSFVCSEFVLALPAGHPLAGQAQVPLSALAGERFVGYPSNQGFHLRDCMDDACRAAGFTPHVVHESETSQVLICHIAAGTGVSVIPAELQQLEHLGGVVFKSLGENAPRLEHGMAWLGSNRNPALHNLLGLDLTKNPPTGTQ